MINNVEIWGDTDSPYYQVSNWGNARSVDHYVQRKDGTLQFCKGKILKLNPDTQGYLGFFPSIVYGRKRLQIHREVAKLFVEVPEHLKDIPINELEVDHYDENKTNNRASNLHWVTPQENANRGTRNERSAKARSHHVIQLTLDYRYVNDFYSMGEAERETGIKKTNISACCSGKAQTAGGYIWKRI